METKIIKETSEYYPKRLKEIKDHPKILYIQGDETLLQKPSIAIVGSRDIDEYGTEQTKRFSSYLAQKDFCIVSGLAKGIDTIAHLYSKDKKGKTIAVIASGFEHIYPEENKRLYEQILEEGGLIVSEWPPETEVDMHRFPKRNRIISGLSVATLVVEAKYRSGSTITAHYAMKQNREVFCIPGNIDKTRSVGTNKLIEQGAYLVMSPRDILDILEFDGIKTSNKNKIKPEYQDIYKQISQIPITENEIARRTNKKINEITEILFMLELDGFIKSTNFGKYILNEV